MSSTSAQRRITAVDIAGRKGGEKIVSLTAYHAHTAGIVDRYCDFILVGDSLGMVMHGLETTVPVTLEMMILQGRAVMRGSKRALVVVDMPFGSYEESREQAFRNAVARAEGDRRRRHQDRRRRAHGGDGRVPDAPRRAGDGPRRADAAIHQHDGRLPRAGEQRGGAELLEADARAIADAGAFAIVLEGIVEPVARAITESMPAPTIGIGASPACDGQILVLEDMLGLSEWAPKFVKRFGSLRAHIEEAVAAYAGEVRAGTFPGPEQVYQPPKR